MAKINIEELNSEQQKALSQIDGAVLVTAGAGSGKTKLLTYRVAYLIENLSVNPYNILAITFTNKAASEMKSRVAMLVDDVSGMIISTFHSLCVRILRQNIEHVQGFSSNFSIYDESDSERVLKKIYNKLGIDLKDDIVKKVPYHISNIKNNAITLDDYVAEHNCDEDIDKIAKIYLEYQEELKSNNAFDFDDLQLKAYELLKNDGEVREYYHHRFKYILVDEFQDTNQIQYALIKLLCHENPNIFVVGDEDQCIYTWRGANFKNIFDFKKDFNDVKVFKLEQNYRSTKKILEGANKVIACNKARLNKTLFTNNADGEEIKCYSAYDEKAEAEYVCMQISKLVSSGNYSYSDIAVLSRLNALSFSFEERFLSYGIPYKVFGGFKFYDRAEIKNVLSYLQLFANPNDEVSFLRVINFPKRGIGQVAVNNLRDFANEKKVSLLGACIMLANDPFAPANMSKFTAFGKTFSQLNSRLSELKINEFADEVINMFAIKSAYDSSKEAELDKVLNINTFLNSTEEYVKANPTAGLDEYLESVSLISDIDGLEESDKAVKLATIHAVKGLEFKVVFVVGLEEKIFPISRAFEKIDDMEEERRLMYVAMTRAKNLLFLTRAKTRFLYGNRDYMLCSRFLTELGYNENVKKQITVTNESNAFSQPKQRNDWAKLAGTKIEKPAFQPVNTDISIFKTGQHVEHKKYGDGDIISVNYEEKTADISFAGFGKKTLMLEIAPLTIKKEL